MNYNFLEMKSATEAYFGYKDFGLLVKGVPRGTFVEPGFTFLVSKVLGELETCQTRLGTKVLPVVEFVACTNFRLEVHPGCEVVN